MIVFSHPRSGSTYLCTALTQHLSAMNLVEFFNIGSPWHWGNIALQRTNLIEGTPTIINTFRLNDNAAWTKGHINKVITAVSFVVTAQTQIDEFVQLETTRRLHFLERMDAAGQQYVVKHFLTHPNDELNKKLFALPNKILIYRKDFKEVILSILIKKLHYDVRPGADGTSGGPCTEIAHNEDDTPAPQSTPMVLDPILIRYSVIAMFQLYVNYNEFVPIETISYEDMFAGGTITVNGIRVSPMDITNQYVKRPELKMDYSLTGNKIDFFIGPDNVSSMISDLATEQAAALGIVDIVKKLGVHW
jgi:hypothetical protein